MAAVPQVATLIQPAAPSGPTSQTTEAVHEVTTTVAAPVTTVTTVTQPSGEKTILTETLPAGTVKHEVTSQKTTQMLSGQQEGPAKMAAQLNSLRPLQYIGLLLILVSVAMFHPFLFALLGASRTTQLWIGLIGLALEIVPIYFVTYEREVCIAAVVLFGLWVFAHYHGGVAAELKTLKADLTRKNPPQ